MTPSPFRLLPCLAVLAACATPAPVVAPAPAAPPAPPAPVTVAAPTPPPAPPTSPTLRLPASVQLTHAALDLTLDPAQPTYRGVARFELQLAEKTPVLWLNALDLKLGDAKVTTPQGVRAGALVPGAPGFVGYVLQAPVGPGAVTLEVPFEGSFDRVKSQGLYAVEEGGAWYAYTFFEPIDARRAFPCFDEPSFKVPWKLTFHVPKAHVARANAPVASETEEGAMKTVAFADSKPMSSYMVAFMVGPFDIVDGGKVGQNGVALQFVLPRGRGPEARYAVSVTPRIISLLEEFFGMAYPYEKLDVAVVPRFWGTMEHPGIVALGQPLTLIKPEDESNARKQSYVNIAIHELAHYWFGDYVTCAWWDDTWLNETFATWLDEKLTDRFEPSWQVPLSRAGQAKVAINADALVSAKRLRQPVESSHDIEGSFDNEITYAKGASLAKMFEHYLGEEKFRTFIRHYLAAHAWKNATTEDFLKALSDEAGPEVARAFGSFVDQPGVPRVTFDVRCEKGKAPVLGLAQERFLPPESKGRADAQHWSFPLCVRYGAGGKAGQACTLLTEKQGELPLDAKACPEWVLGNADGKGYYRVGYRAEQLRPLLARRASLSKPEQLALVGDLSAGARRGDVPLEEALALVPALSQEPNRFMATEALELVGLIPVRQLPEADMAHYHRFIAKTFGPRARALGLAPKKGESQDDKELRGMLLHWAAVEGEDVTLASGARALAQKWLADRRAVEPELAGPVLGIAAATGDAALFEQILAEARKTEDRQERARLLFALGEFREPALVQRAIGLVSEDAFDLRESIRVLQRELMSREGRDAAWAYTKANYDAFQSKMRADDTLQFINSAVSAYCDDAHRADVEAFFKPRVQKVDGAPRVLAKGLERMDLCIGSVKRRLPGVSKFLSQY